MSRIRILPEAVANKIAAGEVVGAASFGRKGAARERSGRGRDDHSN